jgi:leucine efflux protein
MTNIDWIGFILASVAVVLAPGPGSMFVARAAASGGIRTGRSAMLGIMVGDTSLIFLSMLGVSALFLAHPSVFHIIRLAGAGYLVFLGLQAIFAKWKRESNFAQDHSNSFSRAISITLLNPKAIFFFMAFFPVFIKSAENGLVVAYAVMTLVFMTISTTYLFFLIHASSRVALAFQQNRTLKSVAEKLCGCIFIGFGVKVAMASK